MNRTIPDAQGQPGSVTHAAPEPCLICGNPSVVRVDGHCLHLPCWQMTTAADRQLWAAMASPVAPAQPQGPPATHTAPPQAPASEPTPPPVRGRALANRPVSTGAPTGRPAIAAVVDAETTWISDGRQVPTPDDITHVGHLAEFGKSLGLGMTTKAGLAAGQLWVTQDAAYQWGVDLSGVAEVTDTEKAVQLTREATQETEFVTHAVSEGWVVNSEKDPDLQRWTRVHPDSPHEALWVVLVPCLGSEALTKDNPAPQELAARLGRLAEALQYAYHLTPAITGMDHMRGLRVKRREEFAAHEPCPPAQLGNAEPAMSWTRKPTQEEAEHTWLHAYDRGGSYLGALAGLDFGVGTPEHHPQGCPFDGTVAGYWRIEVPESGDWRYPNILDPATINSGSGRERWVTTPALKLAHQMDLEPEVLEAWTWERKARVMEPWYKAMQQARETLIEAGDPTSTAALQAVKAIYTRTFGMMGSHQHMGGREGYAPERRHMIIAQSNANMIRRIVKIGEITGRWPVAVDTDTILYTSNEEDPDKAWPLADQPEGERWYGRGLGQYKHEGTTELEYQLHFLTGGAYRGKDALLGGDV